VSASDARISRRLLRKWLRETHACCTACSAPLDEHAHRAWWIDGHGHAHEHLVCHGCMQHAAERDQKAVDELATRCALALCKPGGRA
jgi:hypothetical protein